jgi:hypothetical protein
MLDNDGTLKLSGRIGLYVSESTEIGDITHSNPTIRNKSVELLRKAYHVNQNEVWVREVHKEIDPLASIAIRSIRNNEFRVFLDALNSLEAIAKDYFELKLNFKLISKTDTSQKIRIGYHFFPELVRAYERMLLESLRERNERMVEYCIMHGMNLVKEVILNLDFTEFSDVQRFFPRAYIESHNESNDIGKHRVFYYLITLGQLISKWIEDASDLESFDSLSKMHSNFIGIAKNVLQLVFDNQDSQYVDSAIDSVIAPIRFYSPFAVIMQRKYELLREKENLESESSKNQEIEAAIKLVDGKLSFHDKGKFQSLKALYYESMYALFRFREGFGEPSFVKTFLDRLIENIGYFGDDKLEELLLDSLKEDTDFFLPKPPGIPRVQVREIPNPDLILGYLVIRGRAMQLGQPPSNVIQVKKRESFLLPKMKDQARIVSQPDSIWLQLFGDSITQKIESLLSYLEESNTEPYD